MQLVGKQAYKLQLPKNWKIYDVFHVSLLEQDTIRKRWVDKNIRQIRLNTGNNKKFKVKTI